MLVNQDWLKQHINDDDLIILDSRSTMIFLSGHLPNSHLITIENVIKIDQYGSNLVFDEPVAVELFGRLGINENKTVVVSGDYGDPSAARIAWTLLYFGHEKTLLLDNPISELPLYGFEFTKRMTDPTPTKFIPNKNSQIRIEADDLNAHLENYVMLDARTIQEFVGGHLPGSILIPFTDGIGYGKMFQEKEFLEQMFLQKNISKENQIVCYCMHGHRASSLFFQLRLAGYENVKLYDGSFVEWYGKRLSLQ